MKIFVTFFVNLRNFDQKEPFFKAFFEWGNSISKKFVKTLKLQ